MTDAKGQSLAQRILAAQAALGKIKPTGNNQFKAAAVSIEDVEGQLQGLLAEHGVLTRWSHDIDAPGRGLEDIGNGKIWRVYLVVEVSNAENKDEWFVDHWSDIGGNPMAAVSFAKKGYYKALLHIAEAEEEKAQRPHSMDTARPPQRQQPRPQATPPRQVNRETGEITEPSGLDFEGAAPGDEDDPFLAELKRQDAAAGNGRIAQSQVDKIRELSTQLGKPDIDINMSWTQKQAADMILRMQQRLDANPKVAQPGASF